MKRTSLEEVDAKTLKTWLDEDKAVLIDIREADEFARQHIPGSRLVPLSGFDPKDCADALGKIGVFHCDSGNRTRLAAPQILGTGFEQVYCLKGGLQSWKKAGLPVSINRKAPISIMRQVQIVAGGLVTLGILLALLISPWFMGLSGFVGLGLMYSGISGTCAMARILAFMPWNQIAAAAPINATSTPAKA